MDFIGTNSLITTHCSTSQVRCSTHLAVQHPPANSHEDASASYFSRKLNNSNNPSGDYFSRNGSSESKDSQRT